MDIKNILKENDCRITNERLDIFGFLKTKHFFTYNDILNNFENIWRASVFRTLNLFEDIWIIRKIDIWWNIMTYELNDPHHHHEHMKCEKCDSIISFHSDNICKKIFEEADKMGFKIKSHNVGIIWTCKNCL